LGQTVTFNLSGAKETLRNTYGPIADSITRLFSGEYWRDLGRSAKEDPMVFNRAVGNFGGQIFGVYTLGEAFGQALSPAVKAGVIPIELKNIFERLGLVQDWGINIPTSLDPEKEHRFP
jgi:hypothetical protein